MQAPDFHNGPITQERAEAAQEWMVHHAVPLARAKAKRDHLERMLKVRKALSMKASEERSAAAQEREAYASEGYQEALMELFEAQTEYEELNENMRAGASMIDLWRSINSNLRASRT